MNGGGAEREGGTESEAGSGLRAVSPEPDAGLELTDREIVTWAEVGCSTDWATQAPLIDSFIESISVFWASDMYGEQNRHHTCLILLMEEKIIWKNWKGGHFQVWGKWWDYTNHVPSNISGNLNHKQSSKVTLSNMKNWGLTWTCCYLCTATAHAFFFSSVKCRDLLSFNRFLLKSVSF